MGWSIFQGHWIILFIWNNFHSFFIIFRITLAGITKRAQLPFSRWLPAAIAAPTPVRALVHSSTLVTAGVFLLIRFYPYLRNLKIFNFFILFISTLTIFIAGFSALFECDIKKIVALSTLSQLGVIIASIGLGLVDLAFFHLITHALFKALLFVCVGKLIHLHHHSQDLRSMGNLFNQLPFTLACLNIANLSLCGIPFLSGFYSKDLIIEISIYNFNNLFILFFFILATIITSSYSVRLSITGLFSMGINITAQYTEDSNKDSFISILFLSLGGIFVGCLINWVFIIPFSDPFISNFIKLSIFFLIVFSGGITYIIVILNNSFSYFFYYIRSISSLIFFIVPSRTQIILKFPLILGIYSSNIVDGGWSEKIRAIGVFTVFRGIFNGLQVNQGVIVIPYLSFIFFLIFLWFFII